MAGNSEKDLFERLRGVGLRKQVAKSLSGIGEGAGKKAVRAAHSAIGELRSLADELERRLPAQRGRGASASRDGRNSASRTRARVNAGTTRTRAGARASSAGASSAAKSRPSTPRARRTAASRPAGAKAPAPRGHNKALILQALASGPKTAAEVARETGIATGTTSTTLNKLARSGEVVKATRGYALPGSQ
jgi:predicted Rossmann fold nucleotide-binding protein DprA/Smf involved in DNA uptake